MEPLGAKKNNSLGQKPLVKRVTSLAAHKTELDKLCQWIDEHLSQPIGWQELMAQSQLDHQTIHALFFKYESTTPMTWIRRRREAHSVNSVNTVPQQLISKPESSITQAH